MFSSWANGTQRKKIKTGERRGGWAGAVRTKSECAGEKVGSVETP